MPELLPGQLLGIALGQHLDGAGADIDGLGLDLDRARERPVHRVVLEEMGVVLGRDEVVDGHDLDIAPLGLDDGAQHVATDAAEAGDCDAGGHGRLQGSERWGCREFWLSSAAFPAPVSMRRATPAITRPAHGRQHDAACGGPRGVLGGAWKQRAKPPRGCAARRLLTLPAPAPIVSATRGRRRPRLAATQDQGGSHANGPASRWQGRPEERGAAWRQATRQGEGGRGQCLRPGPRGDARASGWPRWSASARPCARSWSASAPGGSALEAGARGNARPHRLGARFAAGDSRCEKLIARQARRSTSCSRVSSEGRAD